MLEHRRFAGVVLLALVCALASAQAAQPRVTVLPFEGLEVPRSDLQALTLFFETALQNTGRCQIVEQTEVGKILKAHEYVLSDFNDPTKAVAIGRLIPADHIVLGTVGKLAGRHFVNVKMVELRTGTIVGARNATADDLSRLSGALTDVAGQLMGLAPASVAAAPGPAPVASGPATSALPGGLLIREASLAFFESGPGFPPYGQRAYAVVFDTRYTRYINWELTLRFEQVAAPLIVPLEARYLRADGSVLAVQNMDAEIGAGWDWSASWNGWGAENTRNWSPGLYTVQAFAAGRLVASATFSVR